MITLTHDPDAKTLSADLVNWRKLLVETTLMLENRDYIHRKAVLALHQRAKVACEVLRSPLAGREYVAAIEHPNALIVLNHLNVHVQR